MMQAFYYTHHIQAAELAVDVVKPSPYRLSLEMDINEVITISEQDEVLPVKVLIDKDPGFDEPVELLLGNKVKMFSLEPVSIMPEESEKTIYIQLNKSYLESLKNKKWKPT